jgi:hypothetical protein
MPTDRIMERGKFTSVQRRKMGRGSTVLRILLISGGRKARDQGMKPGLMDLFNFMSYKDGTGRWFFLIHC